MRDTLTITAADGTDYTVVYLPAGQGPGKHTAEPRVEFYDLTGGQKIATDRNQTQHLDADALDSLANVGHFTGGRYYVSTMLGEDSFGAKHDDHTGLDLAFGQPYWTIDADTMRDVRNWLRARRDLATV